MATLTKDAILAMVDLPVRAVEVPEWDNSTVYVRSLPANELLATVKREQAGDVDPVSYALLFLCDEQGHRLFSDDDRDALAGKKFSAISRIADAGLAFNKVDGDAVDEAGNE